MSTMLMKNNPLLPLRPFYSASLPLPPGVNKSYKRVTYIKKGKTIRALAATPELEQFKQDAMLLASQGFHDWELIDAVRSASPRTPLTVSIIFYFPTLWRKDVDGGVKAVIDCAFQRLGINDNLVKRLVVEKEVDHEEPRVEIEISFYVK